MHKLVVKAKKDGVSFGVDSTKIERSADSKDRFLSVFAYAAKGDRKVNNQYLAEVDKPTVASYNRGVHAALIAVLSLYYGEELEADECAIVPVAEPDPAATIDDVIAQDEDDDEVAEKPRRGRGRPRKDPEDDEVDEKPKRGRGRPRKEPEDDEDSEDEPKRGRGRPRKEPEKLEPAKPKVRKSRKKSEELVYARGDRNLTTFVNQACVELWGPEWRKDKSLHADVKDALDDLVGVVIAIDGTLAEEFVDALSKAVDK